MSDVPTSKWEAKLHGAGFQIHGCGGYSKVVKFTGLRICMLELYEKYYEPFDISRVTLYFTLVWLKHWGCPPSQAVKALEMLFFWPKNPLLRAPRNCTMACDPSTHIFSCALLP